MKKKIGPVDYKIAKILNVKDVLETCEPRTQQEEIEHANKQLENQLKSFRNKATGKPLFESN